MFIRCAAFSFSLQTASKAESQAHTELLSNVQFNEPLQTLRTLRQEKERVIPLNATWYQSANPDSLLLLEEL